MAFLEKWRDLKQEVLLVLADGQWLQAGELYAQVRVRYDEAPSDKTIRRALESLEYDDGLVQKHGEARARRWRANARGLAAGPRRALPVDLSLALLTLERLAANLLPGHVIHGLAAYFEGARRTLGASPIAPDLVRARAWADKTVRIEAGYPLIAPRLDGQLLDTVRHALYRNEALKVLYRNSKLAGEPACFDVVPLALVERGPLMFLVACRRRRNGEFRRYILRMDRMIKATSTGLPGTPDPAFNLDTYVRGEHVFDFFPQPREQVLLHVREHGELRNLFREQKLAEDQEIVEHGDGFLLTASVIPSVEFTNLLLERAHFVEVVSPAHLRRDIATKLRQACLPYADDLVAQTPVPDNVSSGSPRRIAGRRS